MASGVEASSNTWQAQIVAQLNEEKIEILQDIGNDPSKAAQAKVLLGDINTIIAKIENGTFNAGTSGLSSQTAAQNDVNQLQAMINALFPSK